jgi:hypothetical protein
MRVEAMPDDVASAAELVDRYVSTRERLMGPLPKHAHPGAPAPPEPAPEPEPEPESEPDWHIEMFDYPALPPLPGAAPPDMPFEEKAALVVAHAPPSRTLLNPIPRLQGITARVFGVKVRDLIGVRRLRVVCQPRMLAMAIAKELYPTMSLPQIGRRFGGRDHTTVMHAHRKYGPLIKALRASE